MEDKINLTKEELIRFISIYDLDENGNNFYTQCNCDFRPDKQPKDVLRLRMTRYANFLVSLPFINKIEFEYIDKDSNGYRLKGNININQYINYITNIK